MRNWEEIAFNTIIVIGMIALSSWFWFNHGKFLEACLAKGKTQHECWELMR